MKKNKIYASGIVKNEKWAWQGTVIAPNKKRALEMMVSFKKKEGINGRCEVTDLFNVLTDREEGVRQSTILHSMPWDKKDD